MPKTTTPEARWSTARDTFAEQCGRRFGMTAVQFDELMALAETQMTDEQLYEAAQKVTTRDKAIEYMSWCMDEQWVPQAEIDALHALANDYTGEETPTEYIAEVDPSTLGADGLAMLYDIQ